MKKKEKKKKNILNRQKITIPFKTYRHTCGPESDLRENTISDLESNENIYFFVNVRLFFGSFSRNYLQIVNNIRRIRPNHRKNFADFYQNKSKLLRAEL